MEKHIRKSRMLYKEKNTVLIDSIKKYFGKNVTIIGADTSLHILLRVKTEHTEQELIDYALKAGVKVNPTSIHWRNSNNNKYPEILIGFAGIRIEDIPDGIKALKESWF
jgi:GntR family transcriptional regulator / MocR family aminotransferase